MPLQHTRRKRSGLARPEPVKKTRDTIEEVTTARNVRTNPRHPLEKVNAFDIRQDAVISRCTYNGGNSETRLCLGHVSKDGEAAIRDFGVFMFGGPQTPFLMIESLYDVDVVGTAAEMGGEVYGMDAERREMGQCRG